MTSGTRTVETRSPEDTVELGRCLAPELHPGDVVLLSGPIGAGKSVLTRGIGAALGVEHWRGSPTFNLIHEYGTTPVLYHVDLYRLSSSEIESLGLDEYVRADSLLLVEWADRAPEYLQTLAEGRVLTAELDHLGGDCRCITLRWNNPATEAAP